MKPSAASILEQLEIVHSERLRRDSDAEVGRKVALVKRYQQARFTETYVDLLNDPRYADASRFFLDDLYGPGDQSLRDAQFARIVPALARLFPGDVVATVESLARLHAVSERLDGEMSNHIAGSVLGPSDYRRAWQQTGQPELRALQLELTLAVGRAMQLYTKRPVMRHVLRSMRGPAKVAALGELQTFLERGFDIFSSMREVNEFLSHIAQREKLYADSLFNH